MKMSTLNWFERNSKVGRCEPFSPPEFQGLVSAEDQVGTDLSQLEGLQRRGKGIWGRDGKEGPPRASRESEEWI